MSTPPTNTPIPLHPAPTPHAYCQVLDDLIHMGVSVARALHAQATAHAQAASAAQPPAPRPDPDTLVALAAAFDRIARAVRRSILLHRTLQQPLPALPDHAAQRAAARKRIIREVEDRIGREVHHAKPGPGQPDLHALTRELNDRLDGPDMDADLASRPTADIIAEICRDLGLGIHAGTQPWRRRTPADIQDLCARAAAACPPPADPAPAHGASPAPTHPDAPQPGVQTLIPRAQLRPAADGTPPDDPAALVAKILRHPAARDRPPPGG